MFLSDPLVGFIAFAIALLVSRVLGERALKRLSTEEKAQLLDSFSANRTFSMVALVVLMLLFFIASKTSAISNSVRIWSLLLAMVVLSVATTLFSYIKLKNLKARPDYINNFLIRSGIYYVGLGMLLYALTTRYFPV